MVSGDEDGMVWGWEVETVRSSFLPAPSFTDFLVRKQGKRIDVSNSRSQGAPLGKRFKAHEKAILWTAFHEKEQQLITAGADGAVKVWGTG